MSARNSGLKTRFTLAEWNSKKLTIPESERQKYHRCPDCSQIFLKKNKCPTCGCCVFCCDNDYHWR